MNKKNRSNIYLITSIAALSGILFGFDTGVISGALIFIKLDFPMSPAMEGALVSAVLFGACVGSLLYSKISDYFERRINLIQTAIVFMIGSCLCMFAINLEMLFIARIFIGLAIGVSSYAVPLYISEIAAANMRGTLVSFFQLAITLGILVAFIINSCFANLNYNWQIMFGVGLIPAILLVIGVFFLPPSPRWLILKGRDVQAQNSLQKLRGNVDISTEFAAMKNTVCLEEKNTSSWKMVFAKQNLPVLWIAIFLMFFMQVTGINAVLYYAPQTFKLAGFQTTSGAILATVGIGIVNVLATIIAMNVIDKIGRKPLLYFGLSTMTISLIVLAMGFYYAAEFSFIPWLILISTFTYIIGFATSMGIVGFILISEIFPLNIRGAGMGIAVSVNWACNIVVCFLFPVMISMIGPSYVFFIFALISFVGIFYCVLFVPETKNISLEYIEANLRKGLRGRNLSLMPDLTD